MSDIILRKEVAELPTPLEADCLYFVRVGSGFDIYLSDHTGSVAHKLNTTPIDSVDSTNTALLLSLVENHKKLCELLAKQTPGSTSSIPSVARPVIVPFNNANSLMVTISPMIEKDETGAYIRFDCNNLAMLTYSKPSIYPTLKSTDKNLIYKGEETSEVTISSFDDKIYLKLDKTLPGDYPYPVTYNTFHLIMTNALLQENDRQWLIPVYTGDGWNRITEEHGFNRPSYFEYCVAGTEFALFVGHNPQQSTYYTLIYKTSPVQALRGKRYFTEVSELYPFSSPIDGWVDSTIKEVRDQYDTYNSTSFNSPYIQYNKAIKQLTIRWYQAENIVKFGDQTYKNDSQNPDRTQIIDMSSQITEDMENIEYSIWVSPLHAAVTRQIHVSTKPLGFFYGTFNGETVPLIYGRTVHSMHCCLHCIRRGDKVYGVGWDNQGFARYCVEYNQERYYYSSKDTKDPIYGDTHTNTEENDTCYPLDYYRAGKDWFTEMKNGSSEPIILYKWASAAATGRYYYEDNQLFNVDYNTCELKYHSADSTNGRLFRNPNLVVRVELTSLGSSNTPTTKDIQQKFTKISLQQMFQEFKAAGVKWVTDTSEERL